MKMVDENMDINCHWMKMMDEMCMKIWVQWSWFKAYVIASTLSHK
jgi:hypothetical protein